MDEKLREYLLSGNAVAFVGAGPSCELGLPNWGLLSAKMIDFIESKCPGQRVVCMPYHDRREYSEVFEIAYDKIGKDSVVEFLKSNLLAKKEIRDGSIYSLLAAMPFRLYLTTNCDNNLARALKNTKVYFETISNTKADLDKVHVNAKNLIVKLHGSIENPETLVFSSSQYGKYKHAPEYQFYRQKLLSIVDMLPIVLIGVPADLAWNTQSGKDSGIYAVTQITSAPQLMEEYPEEKKYWLGDEKGAGQRLRVSMSVTRRLTNAPLFRKAIKDIKGLEGLSILKNPQGTNFPVSNAEWKIISEQIE